MSYIDLIKDRARIDKKTIVLPESNDKRTLVAAAKIVEEGIADIIMIGDAEKIMDIIDSYDGVLPFNDKVSPEIIKRETGMSKNEFKRAVGNLLKNGRIEIKEKVIRKIISNWWWSRFYFIGIIYCNKFISRIIVVIVIVIYINIIIR